MSTSAFVRRHIFKLPEGEPFATRDLLSYGPRDAVDKILQRMVNSGLLVRLARGVFMKPLYENFILKLPSLVKIALTKAAAFGKQLYVDGLDAAYRLKLVACGNAEPTFCASGCSTSFLCIAQDIGQTRIHFRSAAPRSVKFSDTHIGLILRALKQIGNGRCDSATMGKACEGLNRPQRAELKDAVKWMQKWMSDIWWAGREGRKGVVDLANVSFNGLEQRLGLEAGSLERLLDP